ncbi:MAG TPA: hypothetical protein VN224_16785 [Xanthomonadales bacterium]|nr:hypothetical protein [Xanthomonadales bacterium]
MIAAALSVMLAASPAPAKLSTCTLYGNGTLWYGACGPPFDRDPRLKLARAPEIVSGVWRTDVKPVAVWSGDMTDSGYPNAPVELEFYRDGSGVLRTEYGWFPASGLVASATALQFTIDSSREVPPSELDRQIVRRADAILSSASVWNRADNRKCPATARSWSIYCAVESASIEITGGFHHRRPAMELVRQIIDERTAGRNYHHRLMDYNNDPTTRLADVRTLFAEALARIDSAGLGPAQAK